MKAKAKLAALFLTGTLWCGSGVFALEFPPMPPEVPLPPGYDPEAALQKWEQEKQRYWQQQRERFERDFLPWLVPLLPAWPNQPPPPVEPTPIPPDDTPVLGGLPAFEVGIPRLIGPGLINDPGWLPEDFVLLQPPVLLPGTPLPGEEWCFTMPADEWRRVVWDESLFDGWLISLGACAVPDRVARDGEFLFARPVPEPANLALLGLAFGALAAWLARSRKMHSSPGQPANAGREFSNARGGR